MSDPRDKLTDWRAEGAMVLRTDPEYPQGYEPLTFGECSEDANWIAARLNLCAQQAQRIAELEREARQYEALDAMREDCHQRELLAARVTAAAQAAELLAEQSRMAERAEALDKRWQDIAAETVQQRDAALARIAELERDAAASADALARALVVADEARQDARRYQPLRGKLLLVGGRVCIPMALTRITPEETDHSIDQSLKSGGCDG